MPQKGAKGQKKDEKEIKQKKKAKKSKKKLPGKDTKTWRPTVVSISMPLTNEVQPFYYVYPSIKFAFFSLYISKFDLLFAVKTLR